MDTYDGRQQLDRQEVACEEVVAELRYKLQWRLKLDFNNVLGGAPYLRLECVVYEESDDECEVRA